MIYLHESHLVSLPVNVVRLLPESNTIIMDDGWERNSDSFWILRVIIKSFLHRLDVFCYDISYIGSMLSCPFFLISQTTCFRVWINIYTNVIIVHVYNSYKWPTSNIYMVCKKKQKRLK
jgi:hypothetical protein